MPRATFAALAAFALISLLAACDDGRDEAGLPAPPPLVATETATPSPTAAAPSPTTAAPAASATAAATTTPAATPSGPPAATATDPPGEPVASTASVPTDELPRVVFERADGSEVALPVEVPPRDEYGIGLSGRRSLDERGMVFYYPDGAGNAGFWMSNTHIDLAIAFVTVDGVISEIHEMMAESLEITRPAEPYEFAVEAPAGWYADHGIAAGDAMRLEFDVTEYVQ